MVLKKKKKKEESPQHERQPKREATKNCIAIRSKCRSVISKSLDLSRLHNFLRNQPNTRQKKTTRLTVLYQFDIDKGDRLSFFQWFFLV